MRQTYTYAFLLIAILFSTTSFASDEMIDMPLPDVQVVEFDKAMDAQTSKAARADENFKGHRAPTSLPQAAASAKDRRDMVLSTISAKFPELKGCYQEGLKLQGDMTGKVVMTWALDPEGKVLAADLEKSQLKNKSVEDCLVKKFSDWQFPQQAKVPGSTSRMTYTFHFVPENAQ